MKSKTSTVSKPKKLKKLKKPKKLTKLKKTVPLPIIKKYVKQKCAYIDSDGKRCSRNAIGKGTLCKKHGGNPIIKENLIPQKYEKDLLGISTKFNPAVHPLQYIELSRQGMSRVEIAAKMKVSVLTLQKWAEKFESFYSASEIGDALHEAWWIERGKGGLENRSFNTSLFKFLTSNKLGYSDKMETKSTNLNLHGVLLAPNAVTEDEWENEDIHDVESKSE